MDVVVFRIAFSIPNTFSSTVSMHDAMAGEFEERIKFICPSILPIVVSSIMLGPVPDFSIL